MTKYSTQPGKIYKIFINIKIRERIVPHNLLYLKTFKITIEHLYGKFS